MEFRDGRRWPKGFNRQDALKIYVMSCIADDYEELSNVCRTVREWAEQDGLHFDVTEIVAQLSELMGIDQARAYLLSPRPPHVVSVDFSPKEGSSGDNVWFMLTRSGLEEMDKLDAS